MERRMYCRTFLAVLLAFALAATAGAQTTGRIEGSVTANDGSTLPGVTLTVNSDSLQGERVAVADAGGSFRFAGLPPGEYSITAALDGFASLEQTGVQVGLDRTVTLLFEMTTDTSFGDTVTVTDAAPVVDITSTTSGANFNEKLFQELPVTRTFQGLAFAAPGVTTGATGALGDDNPSIAGASVAENRYVVDGLDSTDPAFGTSASSVPFEFIKEVQVKTGGYEAEYSGALGGVLNVITKSGGNDMQGDLFGYYNDDSLQSEAEPTTQFGQNLGFTEYDFGASVGGKLIEDKLWYFVAVNPSRTETDYTTRTNRENTETEETLFYAGKLTWQTNPSHQLVFSAFGDPRDRTDDAARNSYGVVGDDREFGAETYGLSYNGTLSGSLFAEASIGLFDQTFRQTPFSDDPFYEVRSFNRFNFAQQAGCGDLSAINAGNFSNFVFNPNCLGGTFQQENGDSSRDELRGSLTWFGATGSLDHEIKVGVGAREVEYTDFAHYPGGIDGPAADSTGFVYDAGGLVGERWQLFNGVARLIEYDQNSAGETDEQSIYFQDRVRVSDYFSLNLGVRADAFNSKGNLSDVNQNQELDFSFGDMIAPRVGFTWDVAKNGRSKLYGHYGRFYESVPLDINTRAFGNEQFNLYYFNYPTDGSLPSAQNPGTWFYTYRLGGGTRVDPGIEPMYTTEALLGFEYEIRPNLALGLKATQRELGNVIEDISVDGGQTYFITNPGGSVSANPVTGVPLPAPVSFPEPVRDYEAYELTLNRRFADNWQLYGSYVYSENEGNYGGLFRQDNGQLDPNITSVYDLPELLLGADGPLPNDREHQVKIYGSYLWPFKLITGFYGQWLSGTPISQLGGHPVYGNSERFVTQRGSFGRTPDVWNLDLHLEYPVQVGNGLQLKLVGDVFNVADEQKATAVDQDWTFAALTQTPNPPDCGGPGTGANTSCPNGNPLFGTPTQFQAPRTFRLGVKLSW